MGKFKYSMQNILDIKIKLETQAKNEFSEANRAYLIEKEKLEELFKKRAVYEAALKEQLSGSLNISEINICKKNINSLKSAIRTQLMNVKKAEDMLEVKRVALNELMKERKTHVEVMFGVIPKYTLADVIYENQTIKSIISNGPLGIDFISAGSSVVGLNNLNHKQIHFIVSAINELNSMYDFIIIDTGAGVSEQVMEFVAASNEIVLVTTPEPTSITDSYSLLKALYKRPDFDPSKVCIRVISNRAASKEDGSIVFNKINSVVMQFLNGSLEYLGYVPSDAMVEKAVRQQKILSIYDPTSKAARSFEEIAKRLLDNESAALDEKRTISHVFSNFFNRKQ